MEPGVQTRGKLINGGKKLHRDDNLNTYQL